MSGHCFPSAGGRRARAIERGFRRVRCPSSQLPAAPPASSASANWHDSPPPKQQFPPFHSRSAPWPAWCFRQARLLAGARNCALLSGELSPACAQCSVAATLTAAGVWTQAPQGLKSLRYQRPSDKQKELPARKSDPQLHLAHAAPRRSRSVHFVPPGDEKAPGDESELSGDGSSNAKLTSAWGNLHDIASDMAVVASPNLHQPVHRSDSRRRSMPDGLVGPPAAQAASK